MKKIGIVGGIGWPSTVDYYTEICRRSEARHLAENRGGLPATPEMSIESLDLNTAARYLGVDGDEGSWSLFDSYHRVALNRLEAAGADFAVIACNTAHHRYDAIVRGVGIPVIHIGAEAARECARPGARQVLIIGTEVTMLSPEFRKRLAQQGTEADDERGRARVAELIAELQRGGARAAAERIGAIAKSSFARRFTGRPVVCLACTELPLAFPERQARPFFSVDGVTYVDSSAVHIAAAFDFAVSD